MASELTQDIVERFKTLGIVLEPKAVKERLDMLTGQFKVNPAEAARTVTAYFRKEHGIKEPVAGGYGAPETQIKDIDTSDTWVTLRARVVQVWEPKSESVSQTGLLGDATGVIKYTVFAKTPMNTIFREGVSYEFKNVVTSEWQGQFSIKLNKNTEVKELDEKIEIGQTLATISGPISSLLTGSGLIKRCPECNRKTNKGKCQEHGQVKGIFDLRAKVTLEESVIEKQPTTFDVIIGRDVIETATGFTLEKAKEMATEALDTSVVDLISEMFIGKIVTIEGNLIVDNFIAKKLTFNAPVNMAEWAKTTSIAAEVI